MGLRRVVAAHGGSESRSSLARVACIASHCIASQLHCTHSVGVCTTAREQRMRVASGLAHAQLNQQAKSSLMRRSLPR